MLSHFAHSVRCPSLPFAKMRKVGWILQNKTRFNWCLFSACRRSCAIFSRTQQAQPALRRAVGIDDDESNSPNRQIPGARVALAIELGNEPIGIHDGSVFVPVHILHKCAYIKHVHRLSVGGRKASWISHTTYRFPIMAQSAFAACASATSYRSTG